MGDTMTPFERGQKDYGLDEMENAPLASVGAKKQGEIPEEPRAPHYIRLGEHEEWLRGYKVAAFNDGRCGRCLSTDVNDKRFRHLRGASEWKRECQNCGALFNYTKPMRAKKVVTVCNVWSEPVTVSGFHGSTVRELLEVADIDPDGMALRTRGEVVDLEAEISHGDCLWMAPVGEEE